MKSMSLKLSKGFMQHIPRQYTALQLKTEVNLAFYEVAFNALAGAARNDVLTQLLGEGWREVRSS
jgi:hypothetical protein